MTITCAMCGAETPGEDSYFSAAGEVCGSCNARQEQQDSAAFAAGADSGGPGSALQGASTWSSTSSDGNSTTTVQVTGILGVILNLFRMLFGGR